MCQLTLVAVGLVIGLLLLIRTRLGLLSRSRLLNRLLLRQTTAYNCTPVATLLLYKEIKFSSDRAFFYFIERKFGEKREILWTLKEQSNEYGTCNVYFFKFNVIKKSSLTVQDLDGGFNVVVILLESGPSLLFREIATSALNNFNNEFVVLGGDLALQSGI